MSNEIKATVIFACGLNPHPVTRIEGVRSARVGKMFAPSVHGKARLPDNFREYEVDFPISIADADSMTKLEEVRKAFHARLDSNFDAFIKRWEEASKMIEEKEASKLKALKEAANNEEKKLKSVKEALEGKTHEDEAVEGTKEEC